MLLTKAHIPSIIEIHVIDLTVFAACTLNTFGVPSATQNVCPIHGNVYSRETNPIFKAQKHVVRAAVKQSRLAFALPVGHRVCCWFLDAA